MFVVRARMAKTCKKISSAGADDAEDGFFEDRLVRFLDGCHVTERFVLPKDLGVLPIAL